MEGAYIQNFLLVVGLSSNYKSVWIILLYLPDKYTIYIGILYSFSHDNLCPNIKYIVYTQSWLCLWDDTIWINRLTWPH